MSEHFNESTVEAAALSWFEDRGYSALHGPNIAPGEPDAERDSFGDVVLVERLRSAINRLNPAIPHEARDEALRKVLRPDSPSLVGNNRAIATHEIIEELIQLAKKIREAADRGEDLGLNDDELAFFDARAQNESAMQVMGQDTLKVVATELVTNVRSSVSLDWTGAGKRPGEDPGDRAADPHQVWVSTGCA